MNSRKLILILCIFTWTFAAQAAKERHYLPVEREDFTAKEKLLNFSIVYAAQWGIYYLTQKQAIKDHGSLENYYTNPFRVRFDNDSFDYNIFQHTLSGQFYYLFYRSQAYTEKGAFFWSFMSSLAFEFTIETVTENPSFQDIYQTPVFGTVAGIGIERLSRYLHGTNNFFAHGLAYLINPLSILPNFSRALIAMPTVTKESAGIMAYYEF
ncbi:MAG TPA: DUF3943 domain-containing protein [Bacteriovoracaceae bacterium]|nr:DUF3943 domain-containing protein [Bacteriovoracaceae bacterium]